MKFFKTLVAASVLTATIASAEEQINFEHPYPPQLYSAKIADEWVAEFNKEMEGSFEIKTFPLMALGGKPGQLPAYLTSGVIDMMWVALPYANGRFPALSVFDLPFMTVNPVVTTKAITEYMTLPEVQKELEGMIPITTFVHGNGVLHLSDDATSFDAVSGQRIRVPSRYIGKLISNHNGAPLYMPIPDVPLSFSTNLLDGIVTSWEIVPPLKLKNYLSTTLVANGDRGLYTTTIMIALSERVYNKMTPEQKAWVDAHRGAALAEQVGQVMLDSDQVGIDLLSEGGNHKTVIMSKEETAALREEAKALHQEWIADMNEKGYDGQYLYDKANELLEKYNQ